MIQTYELKSGSYYLFESLSSGRSCYFESDEEVRIFRVLFRRYINDFCEIHKMYLSSEGYRIFLRVRGAGVLRKRYVERCDKKGKPVKKEYIEEEWRIVSEQMRIFHSVYVKSVNRIRGREGVLVQSRYRRYYFEDLAGFRVCEEEMDRGKEIEGQVNRLYRVSKRWKTGVSWGVVRGKDFVEGLMDIGFQHYVIQKLINYTIAGLATILCFSII